MISRAAVVALIALGACGFRPEGTPAAGDARGSGSGNGSGSGSDEPTIDAAAPACTASACPGGHCDHDTCVIEGTVSNTYTCPAGLPCRFECTAQGACENVLMDCSQASSCVLDCKGQGSCESGRVACPLDGPCTWVCRGNGSCESFGMTTTPNQLSTWECCGIGACVSAGCDACTQTFTCTP